MNRYIFILVFLILSCNDSFAQMKQVNGHFSNAPTQQSEFRTPASMKTNSLNQNGILRNFVSIHSLQAKPSDIESIRFDHQGTPIWIELKKSTAIAQSRSMEDGGLDFLGSLHQLMKIENPKEEFRFQKKSEDENRHYHIKYQQVYKGLKVYGAEVFLHADQNGFHSVNGRYYPTPSELDPIPSITNHSAQMKVIEDLENDDQQVLELKKMKGIEMKQWEAEVLLYHQERNADRVRLAWMISVRPNYRDHYIYFIDAHTGEIIQRQNHVCTLVNTSLWNRMNHEKKGNQATSLGPGNQTTIFAGGDGPAIVVDGDLNNTNRVVNSYQISNMFYMIDASKETMFNELQSQLPDEPIGTIWTIDANGTSPQNQNFSVSHIANTDNNWAPLEVSAHFNGGEAFEYFLNTFSRNSINGLGGNIISMINVTDENGLDMDNAFWNGAAMFYGNGIEIFDSPLAKALDVAGHEFSHGVIQNTANLEYVGQSGALNESYADIFGAMIDRDDWQMGEDVVDHGVFSTGALRDLANPNNGGNQLGDPGWQPKDMNEYVVLPETPQGDFGGVHINSGIVNRAFFLFANEIGKSKAEQIYYKALNDYLVKSSQFIDARNAVIQSAKDLHGENAPEVSAAENAFNQVGIGAGEGGNYQEDLGINPGQDVVLSTDEDVSAWYYIPPDNPDGFQQLIAPAPLSTTKLSMTDDGSIGVYVDNTNNFQLIEFNWENGLDYEVFTLETNPQGGWRNIVISKDGSKIAYLTESLNNRIRVFDFVSETFQDFELYNPTTANNGSTTGEVQFADVMEFDYSGEFLMYDALNAITGSFGDDITYWDISFLKVWDHESNSFGSGQIGKLFTSLPENVSVGNATFSKNSPYIVAFDFIETERDIFGNESERYLLKAANLETGDLRDVFSNVVLSYPTYSRTDEQLLFDANDNQSNQVLATIDLEQDKITSIPNSAQILITGASKGTWSQTGERNLSTAGERPVNQDNFMRVYPNPASSFALIEFEKMIGEVQIEVYSKTGQLMYQVDTQAQAGPNQIRIDMVDWPAGVYEIILYDDGEIHSQGLLKQE